MIAQPFDYSRPETLDEALALLADGSAKALAGGQSLIPLMKLRLAAPERVVDLGRIAELCFLREEGGTIHLGAMTTHRQIESSDLVRSKCPLLAETAACVGDPQVRNLGTLGGSIAHADPAADYPAALLALEARLRLRGAGSERTIRAEEFFLDTFTTALAPGEIVAEIIVPVEEPGTGAAYVKMPQPASGFAIVGVAARIRKSGGAIPMARVGIAGVGPKAYRATQVERLLERSAGAPADIQAAAALAADGVEANSDLHASAEYRRQMAKVYTARAVAVALSRTH